LSEQRTYRQFTPQQKAETYELEVAGELSRDWEPACASPDPALWLPPATGQR